MRSYEELFIIRPDAPEEAIDAYIEQLTGLITSSGGTVEKVDKWGVRKLAYRVEKRSEGFYVLIVFAAGPALVKELERRLRVSDLVIKFITVRVDERMKKIEKRRKAREKRAKRRPVATVTPASPALPAAPASPAPGIPGAEAMLAQADAVKAEAAKPETESPEPEA